MVVMIAIKINAATHTRVKSFHFKQCELLEKFSRLRSFDLYTN